MKINLQSNFVVLVSLAFLFGCSDDSADVPIDTSLPSENTVPTDNTAPILAEITSVTTPSFNTTPTYVFTSDSVGVISYTGSCQSDNTNAIVGENSSQFTQLEPSSYSDCVINVTDEAGNSSLDLAVSAFTIEPVDETAPIIAELTPVATPLLNTSPSYTFTSDSIGQISYSGSCQSNSVNAVVGDNTIEFSPLTYGSYSGCIINVTDEAGNKSLDLTVSDFTILSFVDVHQANIQFPIANANLGGIEKMSVRGIISRTDDNNFVNTDVTSVLVNGQAANVNQDDSGQWSLIANILATTGDLSAVVTYSDGSSQNIVINVSNQAISSGIQDIEYDKSNRVAYIANGDYRSIVEIDLATGQRMILKATDGNRLIDKVDSLALDVKNKRLIVADNLSDHLVQVDLSTGNQALLSDVDTGSGSMWDKISAIVYDETNDLIYLADSNQDSIYKVELASGNRTVVASSIVGTGNNFDFIKDIQLDINNNRLLVLDSNAAAVVAVNLTNGNRTTVSSSITPVGTGDSILSFDDLNYDSALGKLFVTSYDTLIEVDPSNGNRTTFSELRVGTDFDDSLTGSVCCTALDENGDLLYIDSNNAALYKINTASDSREKSLTAIIVGSGEEINWTTGLAINTAKNTLYLADDNTEEVFSIAIETGVRNYISGPDKGIGDTMVNLEDIEYDQTSDRLIVVDNSLNKLLAIDITTGNRTEISGTNVGSGSAFNGIEGLTIDQSTNTAYITDNNEDDVFKVDLTSGDRTLFSGSGNLIPDPQAATFDHVNNQLYIADDREDQIVLVNTDNGDRTDISSDLVGSGPDINIPQDITFDTLNNQLIMADDSNKYILAIDPITGERTELWSQDVGNGMNISGPEAITIDNEKGIVYIVAGRGFVTWAMDVFSGDRVIISH